METVKKKETDVGVFEDCWSSRKNYTSLERIYILIRE